MGRFKAVGRARTQMRGPNPSCENGSGRSKGKGSLVEEGSEAEPGSLSNKLFTINSILIGLFIWFFFYT